MVEPYCHCLLSVVKLIRYHWPLLSVWLIVEECSNYWRFHLSVVSPSGGRVCHELCRRY